MDTLTFLIKILDAVVGCAKLAGLLVVAVIFAVNVRRLPMRVKSVVTRTTAAFLFTAITIDCLQNLSFVALSYSRLISIISCLTNSVMLFLVLVTVLLCCTCASWNLSVSRVLVLSVFTNGSHKSSSRSDSRKLSSSFLATTPVLLA